MRMGALRLACMPCPSSPIPADVLSLHLAGGTADDCKLLVEAFGPPGRWLERRPDEWRAAGLSRGLAAGLLRLRDGRAAQAEREECARRGVRMVLFTEEDFPARLLGLPQKPLVLTVQGRWPPPEAALGVVGSRAATPYGLTTTRRLAGAAARAGRAIVSGLARGIDRAAHEAALAEGGWCLAVLGNGLLVPYPPEHAALQASLARRGTLISEFALRQPPLKWTFPRRNRLIAALCAQLLVVEAGRRSGALITARHAQELQRDVLVVPGPIDSETSAGTNELIADGAQVVLGVPDLLLHLDAEPGAAEAAGPRDPLLAALGAATLPPDELARRLQRPVAEVRAALVALELAGRVQRLEGDRYAAR
jgi:DNA processing protein